MPEQFFKILPSIASQPLAIVAYICVGVVWLWLGFQRAKSKNFLLALKEIPETERGKFCRNSGFKYEELAQLPEGERLELLTRRYLLIAFAITILALLLFVLT